MIRFVVALAASLASRAGASRMDSDAAASISLGRGAANSSLVDRLDQHAVRVMEQCDAIQQCFCIKRSPCGWCDTTGKAMLGTEDGPLDAEHCPHWVSWADDCPTLYCHHGEWAELRWFLSCGWLPLACLFLWIAVYWARADALKPRARRPGQPEAGEGTEMQQMFLQGEAQEPARGWAGPAYPEPQINDMFQRKRTFEAFRKGLSCPKEMRLQEGASRPYEQNLSDLSVPPGENCESSRVGPHRFSVTLNVALQWRTALGASLVSTAGIMFLSALYLTFLRVAARRLDKEDYNWLAMVTKDFAAVMNPLQAAVSMLLSFYALNRVAWYWSVMMEGFIIQGRSHDLGMIGGVSKRETEEDWRERYRLYRYLAMNFWYTYEPLAPKLSKVGMQPLLDCGLLEPLEAEILKAAHRGPLSVTEGWIANWVAENLQAEAKQQAFQALRELRRGSAIVGALTAQRAPVSFESLLYVVVYCLIAILPFAPSNIDYNNRRAVMEGMHLATVLGDGILCAFYLALINMLRNLQAPFDDIGAPYDALNPVAILNSTERKLRDYLGTPSAELIARDGLPALRY